MSLSDPVVGEVAAGEERCFMVALDHLGWNLLIC